ncbi:transcription repressor NadR [Macrococcoides canis]|nr:transcription repressor NadR [Macrococcus canis]
MKMNVNERRLAILQLIKESTTPISGNQLAQQYDVSRQIIVSDIAQLRAEEHPIKATKQGYIFQKIEEQGEKYKRTITVRHTSERMLEELKIIVENGAMIDNVSVNHPIYGKISVELMLRSVEECYDFSNDMEEDNGRMLAELTYGIHDHVISAKSEKILDNAVNELRQEGFMYEV